MAKKSAVAGDRSVHVGGNAIANNIITGDKNKATVHYERVTLPPASTVNIEQEIAKLRESLAGLNSEDSTKIHNSHRDAES